MKRMIALIMVLIIGLTCVSGESLCAAAEELEKVDFSFLKQETDDSLSDHALSGEYSADVEVAIARSDEEYNELLGELVSDNREDNYFGEIVVDSENGVTVDGNVTAQDIQSIVEDGTDTDLLLPDGEARESAGQLPDSIPVESLQQAGCVVQEIDGGFHITKPYQTKRLIVKTKSGILPGTCGASKIIGDGEGKFVFQYDDEKTTEWAYRYLKSLKDVRSVSIDSVVCVSSLGAMSSDHPLLQDGRNRWGAERIESDRFRNYLEENNKHTQIVVAVIDTGVEMTHPFLQGRLLDNGYDFVNNDNDPNDDHMHGTHCSGIIKDNTPDSVRILPVKCLDAGGYGTDSVIAMGIDYAVKNGADIISMSLGGPCTDDDCEISTAIRKAVKAGVHCVVAAGNESKDTADVCPAKIEECITVASVNEFDNLSDFSNFGESVDLCAPGERIWSSVLTEQTVYQTASGTSMATPFVAAAAALFLTENPGLGIKELADKLKKTTVDLGVKGEDNVFGAGVLDFGIFFGDRKSAETIGLDKFSIRLAYSKNYQSSAVAPAVTVLPLDATDKSYETKIEDLSAVSMEGNLLIPKKNGETKIIFTIANGFKQSCRIVCEDMNLWIDYAASSFAGGKGTKNEPYLIKTAEQLAYLSLMCYQKQNRNRTPYFKQIADIDLGGKTWFPIRAAYLEKDDFNVMADFTYDGNGYKIENLSTVDLGTVYSGFFAYGYGCELSNINLINADIDCPDTEWVGGICGSNSGYIRNCYVSGTIAGGVAGGIVGDIPAAGGHSSEHTKIVNCRSDADVSGSIVGGIAGGAINVRIENCVATGCVQSGGLVGNMIAVPALGAPYFDAVPTQIINCVSATNIADKRELTSDSLMIVVGESEEEPDDREYTSLVTNCYYSGDLDKAITTDHCDTELVQVEKVDNALLKTASFYSDSSKWDSTKLWDPNVWSFTDGDYPTLKNQHDKAVNSLFDFKEYRDFVQVNGYYGTDKNLVIPERINGKPVRGIGRQFYSNHVDLVSVSLPDSLRYLACEAFRFDSKGIKSLERIRLGNGLQFIDPTCFDQLSNLKSITIPASVRFIGKHAFWTISCMKSIFFEGKPPSGVTKAFAYSDPELQIYYLQGINEWKKSDYASLNAKPYSKNVPVAVDFIGGTDNMLTVETLSKGKLNFVVYPETADKSQIRLTSSNEKAITVDNSGNYNVLSAIGSSAVISAYYGKTKLGSIFILMTPKYYYNLHFDGHNITQQVPYNYVITMPSEIDTLPDGYKLLGWSKSKTDQRTYYKVGQKVKNLAGPGETLVLYPVLQPISYKVKFYPNGAKGSVFTQSFTYGKAQKLTKNPFKAPTGKVFVGWSLFPDDTPEYQDRQTVKNLCKKDAEVYRLYARWVTVTKCYITYYTKGGTLPKDAKTSYKSGYGCKLPIPTRKGYVFEGWYCEPEYECRLSEITPWNEIGNVRLYAKWKKAVYKVRYYANGGSGKMAEQSFSYNTEKKLSKNTFTAPKGKVFAGWSTKKDGSVRYTDAQSVKNLSSVNGKTIKLYAIWVKKGTFKITYQLDGGKNPKDCAKTYHSGKGTRLPTPTRKGYTFDGWYTDSKKTVKITKIPTDYAKNITLYAKWKKV